MPGIEINSNDTKEIGKLRIRIPLKKGGSINLSLSVLSSDSNRARLLDLIKETGKSLKINDVVIEDASFQAVEISPDDFDLVD